SCTAILQFEGDVAFPGHAFAGEVERSADSLGRGFLDFVERADRFIEFELLRGDRPQALGVGADRFAVAREQTPAALKCRRNRVQFARDGRWSGGGRFGDLIGGASRLFGSIDAAVASGERGEGEEGKRKGAHGLSLWRTRAQRTVRHSFPRAP